MHHQKTKQPDFGTGQKKLGIYIAGFISCIILTLISFWVVMVDKFPRSETFTILYAAAFIQFFIQLLCFLRLNTKTEQGKMNVMSFLFTGVIMISIIAGSLWIMWNCNYFMSH